MQVILIRHSETDGNAQKRYIGRTDEPLSEKGTALAKNAVGDVELNEVYVSPMIRARQTADILFPNACHLVYDDLREMDFGNFEGRSAADMEADPAYRAWVNSSCTLPCPNGESREAFSLRVCAAFVGCIRRTMEQYGEKAVFVVHGGTIMAVMERFAVPRRNYFEYSVKNCCGYVCQADLDENMALVLRDISAWEQSI